MFFKKNKNFFELLLYLIIAVILVYFISSPLNKILFLGLLPLVWKTKRDYIWLVFFFIVEDIPGGLFSGGLANDPYRFPIYTIVQGISFSLRELYLILLIVKVLVKPEYRQTLGKNYFRKELSVLGYYLIFLLFISVLIGMDYTGFRNFYKICINLTLFVSIPLILKSREDFIRFLNVLFPFAIIAILLQVYSLIYGQQLVALFKPGVTVVQSVLSSSGQTEEWQRPIEMVHVLLVCFTGSLFFLNKGENVFKTWYLLTINILSFLGIFMTGTRSWFISLIVIYVYFFISRLNQISIGLFRKTVFTFLIIIVISFIPVIKNQILTAWDRLSTVEKIAEGDITAGGTAKRFNVRAPRVMEGFRKSTILTGAGFSKLYYKYADGHVGYHNMLLNIGIIGMLLFLYIIGKAFILPYNLSKSKLIPVHLKNDLRASYLLLLALMVINIGTQTLGYTPDGANRYVLMVLAFSFINQAINSVRRYINVHVNIV